MTERSLRISSFHLIAGSYGRDDLVCWRIVAGTPSLCVWIDSRGVTLDVGRRRLSWWRPGGWHLFHVRRLPLHWWGRAEMTRNPNARSENP